MAIHERENWGTFGGQNKEATMHFHWQNLNAPGPATKGRAWLYLDESASRQIHWEWHFGKSNPALAIQWADDWENDLLLHIGTPWCSLFWGFQRLWPNWLRRWLPDDEHEIALRIHDSALWWAFCHPIHSWHSGTPKWRYWVFHPADAFLGRQAYSTRPLSFHRVLIPLPEGNIGGEVKISESTWKRPRWPWPTVRVLANIKPDRAAVVPGKGENSWDCGDDAIFEMSCGANTPAGAVVAYVEAVLRQREKYGGHDYQPPAASSTTPADAKLAASSSE